MAGYEFFNVPETCCVGSTIFKNLFYKNGNLSAQDKKVFTDVVDKVTWLYCLKPDTINIKPYKDETRDYSEIEFLKVKILEDRKVRRIAEIIMRAIPYPMILVFRLNDSIKIVTAHESINQNDPDANTIEEFAYTGWLGQDDAFLNKLDIRKMRFTNYYALYSDIMDAICIYNAECMLCKSTNLSADKAREFLKKMNYIETQIDTLRASIKKEDQFNHKMELNIKIKRLEEAKNRLIKEAASNE